MCSGSRGDSLPMPKISKALCLALLAICVIGVWIIVGKTHYRDRTNIVVLIIDTLRADALGCYGSKIPTSPEIDALALQGVRFESAWAQSSWTRPSVGSLRASRYPRSLGLYDEGWQALQRGVETLPVALRRAGFHTIGVMANLNLYSRFGFKAGFDEYSDSYGPDRVSSAKEIFKEALDLVQKAPLDKRTYLELNVMDVHERPMSVHEEYKKLFEGEPNAPYYQSVRQVSADFRAFLDELLSKPAWKDTMVIIVSDHGEGLSDHGCVHNSSGHGSQLYRSQVKVPWIVWHSMDPLFASQIIRPRVRLLDLAPTVLEYLRIPIPPSFQGESVLSLLGKGAQSSDPDRMVVSETEYGKANKVALIDGDFVLIRNDDNWPGTKPLELQTILGQQNGVCTDQSEAHPEQVARMKSMLLDWEQKFPREVAKGPFIHLSDKEVEKLKTLGYLR
jgi:arylsulfatase A-like enzyme